MTLHAEHEVKVLVVDDQDPFRRAMAAVVEATDGFAVVGAVASGEESLEAVRVMRPDLVLMDVNLPGMGGVDATRVISALEPSPVVVLLSTYDEDEFDQAGCGAAAYISKSAFSPERLIDAWAGAQPTDAGVSTATGSRTCNEL
jgi:DNA-binding NarL/FixJ family response regulator